jgi:endonuclease/exonuclease/phosphatase family metal-dependent hydrolase
MSITIGTFNLNNLFSRFNFLGAIDTLKDATGPVGGLTIRYEFSDPDTYRVRTYMGKLIKAKDLIDTQRIAARIKRMNVDVLAVQEVENIDILRKFNKDLLGSQYSYQILIEGNDPRFIDIAVLSKLPIGAVTSFQTAIHPTNPAQPIFGRDMLEVEIWNEDRTMKLFTLYNNHLKSHFVPLDEDPELGSAKANQRRRHQAEVIAEIIGERMRPDSRYILLGDFNDPPDSYFLEPITSSELSLNNALINPQETRPSKKETGGQNPQTTAWTYRHKEGGQPPQHLLYDQIWLSAALEEKQAGAHIDRRTRHGGDGSDHDPAWIEIEL